MEEHEGVLEVAGVVERLGLDEQRLDEGLVLGEDDVGGLRRRRPLPHQQEAARHRRLSALQGARDGLSSRVQILSGQLKNGTFSAQ